MSGARAINRTLTFTTQNTRSLKQNDKIYELITTMKERNVFATCLQETWRTGFTKLELEGFHLLASGLDTNVEHSRRGEQGVGIMLSPSAFNAWKAANYEICKDLGARVMAIRLLLKDSAKNDVGVYLISAYAPVGNSKQQLWDDFFERLELCIKRKRKNDVLILGCDTNSSMGTAERNEINKNSIGKFGLHHRNRAGIRFNTFLEVNGLIALSTYFRKKNYATWSHPRSKLPHQIDHIISQKNDFYRFTDAGTISPLIDSDHVAVKCKIRFISPRKKKICSPRLQMLHLDNDALLFNDI